jgi:tetratricopeptide (TPR) repeat protein
MALKLTLRQLVLSILALLAGLGYKEIGARIGMSRGQVADYLGRKRKTELDDEVYESLLSAVTKRRAAAAVVTGCLEALEALDRESGLSEEEKATVEEEVLRGARLLREALVAAVRRSRTGSPGEDYPHAFELPICRQRAEEQLAELRRLDGRSRLAVVRLTAAYQTWALAEVCCDESEREASRNLRSAASWARLALAIASRVRGPEDWRNRVRGYAFGHWANILKVRGDLTAAESCFAKWAKPLWKAGADPSGALDPGRLLDLEVSLRRAQRRFDDALFLSDQARAVSRCPERILIKKATVYDVMGEYEKAVTTLLEAGPGVERGGDPRLLYMQRFNLAAAYTHLRRYDQAADLLQPVRGLVAERGDAIEANRIVWLEGRILAGLGRRAEARRLLAEARSRFAAEKMFYDVALALLEECGLLLDEGRTGEVKALALELMEVFQSKKVHQEALAALQLFQEAAEREAATAELARRVLDYLFRARHDQGLRFES